MHFDNDFMKLIPEEKEQQLNDQDKQVYHELVNAIIFLKRV